MKNFRISLNIPSGFSDIDDWKTKLNDEMNKFERIIEEKIPEFFDSEEEAINSALIVAEKMGRTDIVYGILVTEDGQVKRSITTSHML